MVKVVKEIKRDVQIEGKKEGYQRAANEYAKVFSEIEAEYKKTKDFLEKQKVSYDIKTEELLSKLESLENQKADLQKEVKSKSQAVSKKYNIPLSDITQSLASGSMIVGNYYAVDIVGLVHNYKEKEKSEAIKNGYAEAKALYEEKITKLKKDLQMLEKKGNKEIQELVYLIEEVLSAIAKEQMKIAELKALL